MKYLLPGCLLIPLIVFGQRFGASPQRSANTFASVPMQVMGEGRLEGLSPGTSLSSANVSNLFSGFWSTNSTFFGMVTNAGAVPPTVGTSVALENQDGFYMPTVTTPVDGGVCNLIYNSANPRPDIFPRCDFVTDVNIRPSVLVVGFTLIISNWAASTFGAYDIFRIGQDPYAIVQFGDGTEVSGRQTILVHTPDGAGIGSPVVIVDNGEVYQIVVMRDGPQSRAAMSVYLKQPQGYKFVGESFLLMTTNAGSPLVENIWFMQHDDHGEASQGGTIRYNNYWMTTNREVYTSRWFPRY